jgi:dihydroxyacetone kinase-like predicted kinase
VVGSPELLKVHLHSNCPDRVVEYVSSVGSPSDVQVDDMQAQWGAAFGKEGQTDSSGPKALALAAIAPAAGIAGILQSLGATTLCSTSPSTEELMGLIERADAGEVLLLPGGRNVLLVAERAAALSPKRTAVVKALSVPEAVAAAIAFLPDRDAAENARRMAEAASRVKTLVVARAVKGAPPIPRSTAETQRHGARTEETTVEGTSSVADVRTGSGLDARAVKSDPQMIGLDACARCETQAEAVAVRPGDIVSIAGTDFRKRDDDWGRAMLAAIREALRPDDEVVTIYRGQGVTAAEAARAAELVRRELPDLDVSLHYGGQAVPEFIIGIE